MNSDENIARAVGTAVGLFPKEMIDLLTSNKIVIDAENYDTNQLVDAVFTGLHSSQKFNSDFSNFLKENQEAIRNF